MNRFFRNIQFRPVIIVFASLCLMLIAIRLHEHFNGKMNEFKSRNGLQQLLILKKSQLEKSLYSRIFYTRSIAAYVSMNPGITVGSFYRMAREFAENDSVISSMSLSENCIISAIYPLKGHEGAMGLNLLEHARRRKIVEETIKTGKTFVAGPVELVEGGIAFISYTPIFTGGENDKPRFWGVTDIVISRDKLFSEAKIGKHDTDFIYGLKGYDGQGAQGGFFWGDPTVFERNPETVEISLPTGSWILAAAPVIGWPDYIRKSENPSYILYFMAFIICILIWVFLNAQAKLRANEREMNETRDKIFSIIAHDLRSPFTAFLGFTEIMSEEILDMNRKEVQEIARSMRKSATSLFHMLEDLLEWSQMQRGLITFNPALLRLKPLVDECIGNVSETARFKELKIINNTAEGLDVWADNIMLQTIIRNILSNAVKFTPAGGTVTVSAVPAAGNTVEIAVNDTGIGMSKAVLDDLFGMNLNSRRKGTEGEPSTGLGLIICKEFVERHKGMIHAASEEGKGSTFYIILPQAPGR